MDFTKRPTTTAEQIELLAARGMNIADRQKAERFLDYCSYYRFRGYGLYFEARGANGRKNQTYLPGTTFEAVEASYHFDARLRRAVFHYASIVEIYFRNLIGNIPAVFYGDSHWYLDETHFIDKEGHSKFIEKCRGETDRHRDEAPVQNYLQKYSAPYLPPIWVLTEYLSFAEWSRLFGNLADKAVVAVIEKKCDIRAHLLKSWLHTMTVVRNACAHHSRIWDRQFSAAPKITGRMKESLIPGCEKKMAAVFLVLMELLEPVARREEFCQEFCNLLKKLDMCKLAEMGLAKRVEDFFSA